MSGHDEGKWQSRQWKIVLYNVRRVSQLTSRLIVNKSKTYYKMYFNLLRCIVLLNSQISQCYRFSQPSCADINRHIKTLYFFSTHVNFLQILWFCHYCASIKNFYNMLIKKKKRKERMKEKPSYSAYRWKYISKLNINFTNNN